MDRNIKNYRIVKSQYRWNITRYWILSLKSLHIEFLLFQNKNFKFQNWKSHFLVKNLNDITSTIDISGPMKLKQNVAISNAMKKFENLFDINFVNHKLEKNSCRSISRIDHLILFIHHYFWLVFYWIYVETKRWGNHSCKIQYG